MELNEKEKKAFKEYNEKFIEEPLYAIEEGLIVSHCDPNEYREFKEASYEYAKRILTFVAEKNGLIVDTNLKFDAKDIIRVDEKLNKDLNPEIFESYDELKAYIDKKIENMNVEDLKAYYYSFVKYGECDSVREFMGNYISKICDNMYKFYYESEEEKKEPIEEKFSVFYEENDDDWEAWDDDWEEDSEEWPDLKDEIVLVEEEKQISNEELLDWIKYLNSFDNLMKYKLNVIKISNDLREITIDRILKDYYDNKDFKRNYEKIMNHDKNKHEYLFHGTQCVEDAEKIIETGLLMHKEDLSSTTYSEFTMDELLLYSRGFGGEIGSHAIVIIDNPIDDNNKEKIVRKLEKDSKLGFTPSGLQGLDIKPEYIVDAKYVVGFVNKLEKKIVYNTKYYDYDRFKEENDNKKDNNELISIEEIGNIILDVDINKKDEAKNRINKDMEKMQEKENIGEK